MIKAASPDDEESINSDLIAAPSSHDCRMSTHCTTHDSTLMERAFCSHGRPSSHSALQADWSFQEAAYQLILSRKIHHSSQGLSPNGNRKIIRLIPPQPPAQKKGHRRQSQTVKQRCIFPPFSRQPRYKYMYL